MKHKVNVKQNSSVKYCVTHQKAPVAFVLPAQHSIQLSGAMVNKYGAVNQGQTPAREDRPKPEPTASLCRSAHYVFSVRRARARARTHSARTTRVLRRGPQECSPIQQNTCEK